jgi:hypothetical protein
MFEHVNVAVTKDNDRMPTNFDKTACPQAAQALQDASFVDADALNNSYAKLNARFSYSGDMVCVWILILFCQNVTHICTHAAQGA